MPIDLSSGSWADPIYDETSKEEYQACSVEIHNPALITEDTDDRGNVITTGDSRILGPLRARFIPVRAGIALGAEAQVNAQTIRAVRFQFTRELSTDVLNRGFTIKFISAKSNNSLVGRWASITDDFQGSTTATRTVHAMMDSDANP